eukprot:GEMP01050142.1.p1 GENE.GEMP01050142.1~~GEMP01050142.1.p1  ORF type:complete len:456 (+),score=99.97 GEMP01050142.1:85-1452(+)
MAVVEARFLTGASVRLEACDTVGDIMTQLGTEHGRPPSDIVVFPMGAGDVLTHECPPPPKVSIVLKKEEDQLTKEECEINVVLYAAAGEAPALARAIGMLHNAVPRAGKPEITRWIRQVLCDAARDASKDKMVRTLMRAGVDGSDALGYACLAGDAGAVQGLLNAGVDIHAQYDDGHMALTRASAGGQKDVVEMVLSRGADINWANLSGDSALLQASRAGHTGVVEMLLSRGADVNHRDRRGSSALMLAARKGDHDVVKALLAGRADIHHRDKYGFTALMKASLMGHAEVVKMLLSRGADQCINCTNRFGDSALMGTCRQGRKDITELLLSGGADINCKDKYGASAVVVAFQHEHRDVMNMLLAAGAVYEVRFNLICCCTFCTFKSFLLHALLFLPFFVHLPKYRVGFCCFFITRLVLMVDTHDNLLLLFCAHLYGISSSLNELLIPSFLFVKKV